MDTEAPMETTAQALPAGSPPPTVDDPTAGGALCGALRREGQVQQDIDRGIDNPWRWCRNRSGHGTDHVGVGRCRQHGGNSPSGRESSRLRYAALQGAVVETFARIMVDPSQSAMARLRAAENLADRGGRPRRSEVDVDAGRETLVERLLALQASDEASS